MNVRITQTVNLEDVPECASKLVSETKQLLVEELFSIDLIKNSIAGVMATNQDLTHIASELLKVRRALSKADTKLEDCMGIVQGYADVIVSLQESNTEEPDVVEDSNTLIVLNEEEENDRQTD